MTSLSESTLLGSAANVLLSSGFKEADLSRDPKMDPTRVRLFEDAYSLVLIAAFSSAGELLDEWPRVQSDLAALITRTIDHRDAKAWDGYLVLLLARPPLREDLGALTAIAYDTRRVRKLVVTPDMIGADLDLTSALLPVLPLPSLPALGSLSSMEQVIKAVGETSDENAMRGLQALFDATNANASPLLAIEGVVRQMTVESKE
jgi:hypothetical protein